MSQGTSVLTVLSSVPIQLAQHHRVCYTHLLPFATVICPIFIMLLLSFPSLLGSLQHTSGIAGLGTLLQVPQYLGAKLGTEPGTETKTHLKLYSIL